MVFCSNCGSKLNSQSKFCPNCGVEINSGETDKSKDEKTEGKKKIYYVSSKNRLVAFGLAILGLLGFAGLHRFYVGKPITGFLYFITFGCFFIGTLYDIYTLYYDTFTDGDGYRLLSDDSMRSNYKRRTSSPNTSVVVTILSIFLSVIVLSGIIGGFVVYRNVAQNYGENQQTVAQKETDKTDKDSKKGKDSKKDKDSKKEKKYKPGPILDIPMNGSPIENITETVKQNTDGLWDMVKLSDVKVDVSSGEANVLIILQGARGLTAQGTLDEFNRVIKQEIAALYQVKPGVVISNVSVNVYMEVSYRDTGATENLLAYKVSMDKSTASKMHWDNYESIGIMSAATDVAMHPSFRKLVKSNAGRSVLDESLETLGF